MSDVIFENGRFTSPNTNPGMKTVKLTNDIRYVDNALPDELIENFLEYMRRLEDDAGLARLYQMGSCKVSFWYPFSRGPAHLIEEVIECLMSHTTSAPSCAGAEWWLNIRRSTQGMPIHFDKDESLLKRRRQIGCPESSSVLYLSDVGQPTFCTNYSLDDAAPLGPPDDSAPRIHVFVPPKINRYLVFRGDLWHGSAKPHNSTMRVSEDENKARIILAVNWWSAKPEEPACMELPQSLLADFHRFSVEANAEVERN